MMFSNGETRDMFFAFDNFVIISMPFVGLHSTLLDCFLQMQNFHEDVPNTVNSHCAAHLGYRATRLNSL